MIIQEATGGRRPGNYVAYLIRDPQETAFSLRKFHGAQAKSSQVSHLRVHICQASSKIIRWTYKGLSFSQQRSTILIKVYLKIDKLLWGKNARVLQLRITWSSTIHKQRAYNIEILILIIHKMPNANWRSRSTEHKILEETLSITDTISGNYSCDRSASHSFE